MLEVIFEILFIYVIRKMPIDLVLHIDTETYAIANRYRPGASSDDSMHNLRAELHPIMPDTHIGSMVLDDLSTHHTTMAHIFER